MIVLVFSGFLYMLAWFFIIVIALAFLFDGTELIMRWVQFARRGKAISATPLVAPAVGLVGCIGLKYLGSSWMLFVGIVLSLILMNVSCQLVLPLLITKVVASRKERKEAQ